MQTRRRQDAVQERRRRKLLRRVRWSARGDADASEEQRRALDWRAVQARLGPVRHRWDLAILCNLDETAGCRPADLLAAINSQAGTGRRLSPQVLSGRLRELERNGYIRHDDLSVMPLHRVYYLQPPGLALLSDLSRIIPPGHSSHGAAYAGYPSAAQH
jgi:DNA-binding HxlR family transcriptional regulator